MDEGHLCLSEFSRPVASQWRRRRPRRGSGEGEKAFRKCRASSPMCAWLGRLHTGQRRGWKNDVVSGANDAASR